MSGIGADALLGLRLDGLGLRHPDASGPQDVVGRLLAVQSQEFAQAMWGIASRVETANRPNAAAMRTAFDAGDILRTHVLRPTWHSVTPRDLRWLATLSAPRVHQALRHTNRQFAVDERFDQANDVIARAVETGPRTRGELGDALAAAGMAAHGQQLGNIVMRAELDRIVVSGPMRGKQHTYAAFDDRVPPGFGPLGNTYDADAALAELLRRYLTGRRLATAADIAWWSGLTLGKVRDGLGLLGTTRVAGTGQLEGLEFHGLSDQADDIARAAEANAPDGGAAVRAGAGAQSAALRATPAHRQPSVDLLQAFDDLLFSFTDSRRVAYAPGLEPSTSPNGAPVHSIAVGGRMAGRWRWKLAKGGLSVEPFWWRKPTQAEQAGYEDRVRQVVAYWTDND